MISKIVQLLIDIVHRRIEKNHFIEKLDIWTITIRFTKTNESMWCKIICVDVNVLCTVFKVRKFENSFMSNFSSFVSHIEMQRRYAHCDKNLKHRKINNMIVLLKNITIFFSCSSHFRSTFHVCHSSWNCWWRWRKSSITENVWRMCSFLRWKIVFSTMFCQNRF